MSKRFNLDLESVGELNTERLYSALRSLSTVVVFCSLSLVTLKLLSYCSHHGVNDNQVW